MFSFRFYFLIFQVVGILILMIFSHILLGDYNSLSYCDDIHVIAGLFKLWIRELKDPLIPVSMYRDCIGLCERVASLNNNNSTSDSTQDNTNTEYSSSTGSLPSLTVTSTNSVPANTSSSPPLSSSPPHAVGTAVSPTQSQTAEVSSLSHSPSSSASSLPSLNDTAPPPGSSTQVNVSSNDRSPLTSTPTPSQRAGRSLTSLPAPRPNADLINNNSGSPTFNSLLLSKNAVSLSSNSPHNTAGNNILAGNAANVVVKVGNVLEIIEKIPELNRNVLFFIIRFLKKLIKPENEAFTKMGLDNIAMVLFVLCLLSSL